MAVRDTSWAPPLLATIRRPRSSIRIVVPTTIQISLFLEAAYFPQIRRRIRLRSCHGEREDQQAANQEWASDRSIAGNRRYRIALSAKPALIHRKEGLKSRQTQCVPFGYPSLPAIPWSDGHESSS